MTLFYSSDPARDWDRYCDEQERLAAENPLPTAQEIADQALQDGDTFAEWLVEYLIADRYSSKLMAAMREKGAWGERQQRKHVRASLFLDAVAQLLAADPKTLTGPALAIHTLGNAAFIERAEQEAEDAQ